MHKKFYSSALCLLFPKGIQKFYLFLVIATLMSSCAALVYNTGGTQFSYLHAFYMPIILASMSFSVRGGILAGIAASLFLGPWMPVDVHKNVLQPIDSILARGLFFILVGCVSGYGAKVFKNYLIELERRLSTDNVTGLPNTKGINEYINTRINNEIQSKYAVVIILVDHLKEISNGLGQELV
ncbi:MAG: GGDEF domain-containing protein, partial [Alphaproteobacteria bacterium]|nr:GGDEF domain-containing protein [Alphaproteobacteria bacterium]